MVRVYNEVTGRFEECSACEQKRLQAAAANGAQFQPQRVPRTTYDPKSYATGSITRPFGMR